MSKCHIALAQFCNWIIISAGRKRDWTQWNVLLGPNFMRKPDFFFANVHGLQKCTPALASVQFDVRAKLFKILVRYLKVIWQYLSSMVVSLFTFSKKIDL